MLSKHNQTSGIFGETIASKYLSSHGYIIVERNFRKRYGEIDIIALDGDTLVFVEVKTRRSNSFGEALEAITSSKIRKLIQSSYFYKHLHPNLPDSIRIDAISIALTADNTVKELKHIKNISM